MTGDVKEQVIIPQFPPDASVHGHRIDELVVVTSFFIGALFLIMVGWMLFSVVRHGKKHRAQYDRGDSRKRIFGTMGVALGVFLVVDGNLWFHSTYDMHELFWNFAKVEEDPRTIRIEINAHQWAWDARYAGPDGEFNTADDIVSLNDIRVPVGAPVLVQLASTDVVHSFYLPNFRVKQDAVPGSIQRAWFTAKETGEFEIACAQHCGINHYKMKGKLTVLTQEEFEKWSAAMSAMNAQLYDPNDTEAHWGWTWRKGS